MSTRAPLGSLQLWCSPCCGLSAGRNALDRSRYIFGYSCGWNACALCFFKAVLRPRLRLPQLLVSYMTLAPSGGNFGGTNLN